MRGELDAETTATPPAIVGGHGQVVDSTSLEHVAVAVADRQAAPTTRKTYASVYRSLALFLRARAHAREGVPVPVSALDADAVTAFRNELEAAGRSTSTIRTYLSAVRLLAAELDVDTGTVRTQKTDRQEPKDLTAEQLRRLLAMPDRRTRMGRRDLAILLLMSKAGLRREEVARLAPDAIVERQRYPNPAYRSATGATTRWAVKITGKRGKHRLVPLQDQVVDAIRDWVTSRPTATTDRLFVSLSPGRPAGPLTGNAIYRIVERHATAADLPADRRRPHVLRHTFATACRRSGAPIEVIRDLLGHEDIATTMIYTRVDHDALESAIDALDAADTPIARL